MYLGDHPYDQRVKEWLNKIKPGIWEHLNEVPSLSEDAANEILAFFVELACAAQNMRNITIGREAILEMPKQWVIAHITESVQKRLDMNDEWEYRRLLEVYIHLDHQLTQRLVYKGMTSNDPGIVEAAQDFSAYL